MSFAEQSGNRAALERLQGLVRSQHLPPGLLFTGPEGVGKLEAALNLAKSLNCVAPSPPPADACDQCPSCLRIEKGEHPDVRVVKPEGAGAQIRAEPVRQVVSESFFRPFEGRQRVYIFAQAERMNPTAANKLLKTLEEPASWTHLVLVTAQESALLPTLVSRCQKIRFLPLLPEELVLTLTRRHGFTTEEARLAAAVSGGSLSAALAFPADQLQELRAEALQAAALPAKGRSRTALLPWADTLSRNAQLTAILRLLLALLRDLVSLRGGGTPVHSDLQEQLEPLARAAPLNRWLAAYLEVEQAVHLIEVRYTNKRITLEQMLLKLGELAAP